MTNPEHLDLLKQGVATWNHWYKEHYWETHPDLRGADLSNMDLSDLKLNSANLEGACLSGCNLQRAYLVHSCFNRADLSHADLRGTHLFQCRLIQADLSHADLREANVSRAWLLDANLQGAQLNSAKIREASLTRANLNNAILSHARLEGTYFNRTLLQSIDMSFARIGGNRFLNVDLSTAHGLETVEHIKPAYRVDIRTLLQAQGRIPEQFMRESGFSDALIASLYPPDGISDEFPTCLLSYAPDDHVFAEQLLHDLQARGIFCHAEPYKTTTGKLIITHDKLLLLLSNSSPGGQSSILHYILKEARVKAYWEFPRWESSNILRLISLDKTLQTRRGDLLGSYWRIKWPHSDFSGWHNQEIYQEALDRLLSVLRHE